MGRFPLICYQFYCSLFCFPPQTKNCCLCFSCFVFNSRIPTFPPNSTFWDSAFVKQFICWFPFIIWFCIQELLWLSLSSYFGPIHINFFFYVLGIVHTFLLLCVMGFMTPEPTRWQFPDIWSCISLHVSRKAFKNNIKIYINEPWIRQMVICIVCRPYGISWRPQQKRLVTTRSGEFWQ